MNMTKNQKLAVGISSSFMIVILGILSLVSSANTPKFNENTPTNNLVSVNNSELPIDRAGGECTLNTWNKKADFGGGTRTHGVSFSIGTKGYVGTGNATDGIDSFKKDFWEWDQATNAWTQKADFGGQERWGATGFSIGTNGYIGTGYNPIPLSEGIFKDFWEYNTITNIWTRKADFGGGARTQAVGFSINGKGYIGTGWAGGSEGTKDFWEYNPKTDIWTKKADFSGTARHLATGFGMEGKGYLGTGSAYSNVKFKDFWEYNPSNNKWVRKADFAGTARTNASSFSIGSKGYIGVGSSTKDFWEYDLVSNTWTKKADFGGGVRASAFGFSIGSNGYIGTGYSNSEGVNKNDFWEYCGEPILPACVPNTWTRKADYGGGHRERSFGFNIGNKVYIGTGADVQVQKKDFWEYNPPTNTWTQKADFEGGERVHAIGFSINGKGYAGTGARYDILKKDFWQYDPVLNDWTEKASLGGMERQWAVGFSINSKGYIGTGVSVGGVPVKDFWEYNPKTDIWTKKADFSGTPRSAASGFAIESKGYIGGGADESLNTPNNWYTDFRQYDPTNDVWQTKMELPVPILYGSSFSIGGKGYMVPGLGLPGPKFWSYDSVSNTWTQKANFEGIGDDLATGVSNSYRGYVNLGDSQGFWEYCPD